MGNPSPYTDFNSEFDFDCNKMSRNKRLPTLLVLLIFGLTLPLHAQNAEELLREGKTALNNKQFRKAVQKLRASVQASETAEGFKFLAFSLLQNEKYRKAARAFRRSLDVNEKQTDLYKPYARTLLKTSSYKNAIHWLERALSEGKRSVDTYLMLGKAYAETEQHQFAADVFRRGLNTHPTNDKFRRHLVYQLQFAGATAEAYRYANDLTKAHPENTENLLLRADLAIEMGKLNEAERLLEQARYLGETRPELYRSLADLSASNNQFFRAEYLYRTYLNHVDDPDSSIHLQLGRALMETKQYKQARTHLRTAAKARSEYQDGLVELGKRLYRNRGFKAARTVLEEALQINSDHTKTHHTLGVFSLREQQYRRAVTHLSESYNAGNRTVQFLLQYIQALRKAGTQKELRSVLVSALATHPKHSELRSLVDEILISN